MHKYEPWRSQSLEPYSEKIVISTKKKSSRCPIYLENFQSDLENEGAWTIVESVTSNLTEPAYSTVRLQFIRKQRKAYSSGCLILKAR
ncbi:unnamed protein product [Hymenolepis diminuta]|uniref:Uncharacterized protein n=1 Tax=Hymenolepis diminuta TaxID=6216 RepID=A0A564YVK0_HYMDI|nr:unnamed protein product [Hymenolepis diminuta]